MKKQSILLAAACALAFSSIAHATTPGLDLGDKTYNSGGSSTAAAGAVSGSTSGAVSGSKSSIGDVKATSGDAFSGSTSGSSADGKVSNQIDGDKVEGDKTFVAPAPVFTIAPQSSGGIVTKSHAVGLGWNLISWSKSEQMTDPFQGGMRLAETYDSLCQYETAAMIRQRLFAVLDPAYRELPAQPGVRNLTPQECTATKR